LKPVEVPLELENLADFLGSAKQSICFPQRSNWQGRQKSRRKDNQIDIQHAHTPCGQKHGRDQSKPEELCIKDRMFVPMQPTAPHPH
jgi:hypothetical protein